MKEIKLTQDKVALVDDEDFEYLNQFKWQAHKDKYTYYAVRTVGQKRGQIKKRIFMHRIIMKTLKGMEVDHKDHNGLNCQKTNMRNCTHLQNGRNIKKNKRAEFIGVNINKGKYIVAHIRINNKSVHLGTFNSKLDAARAYDEAAIKQYGEFANLNFK